MAKYLLILVLVFHFVGNFSWVFGNNTPPAWDQSAHMKVGVLFYQYFRGWTEMGVGEIVKSAYGYPPLVQFLGSIFMLLTGFELKFMAWMITLFFLLAIVGVYKVGGVVAAFLFSFFPVVFDTSRSFLLDMPLLCFVIWAMYFWIKSGGLKKRRESIYFGLMAILAGLTKLNGFLYFLPFGSLATISVVKNKEMKVLRNGLIVLGMFLVGVGWWWIFNWQNIRLYTSGLAGSGEPLTDPMNLGQINTWIHYGRLFWLHQLFPIPAMIALLLMGWWFMKRRKGEGDIWWVFLVVNYVLFTMIKNKDYRFTLPLLPMVAVVMTMGWRRLQDKYLRWGLMGILVVHNLFFYINNSFGWPIKGTVVNALINISDYPIRPVRREQWPVVEVIRGLDGGKKRLLVLLSLEQVNDNNLLLYRDMLGLTDLEILGIDWWGKEDFDYYLVLGPEEEPATFYDTNLEKYRKAVRTIWEQQLPIEKQYRLPTGQEMYLLRRI